MTAVEEARTRRNAAWPHAPHVLERAKIDRQRSDTLSEIGRLQQRIVQARAVSFEDAAVQLRRLVVMAVVEWEAGVRLKTCRTIRRVFRHTMSWVTLTVR